MKMRGTGLLMVWTDIDRQYEAEFNEWYNQEHIAAMLEVPGILGAGRYKAIEGGPKYLAIYELEDHDVLQSAAYRDGIRYRFSERRRRVSGSHIGRNFLRNAYRQIYPARNNPIDIRKEMPPFIQLGRMDMPAAVEEEFNAWYNTAYIPAYLEIPGCLGVRRFRAIDAQPAYLTVYDLKDPSLRASKAWDDARKSNPWSARMQPLRHDKNSPAIYELIFAGKKTN
ncbi:MAG: hypothetical protein WDN48_20045 [Pseudolabrys sp.]